MYYEMKDVVFTVAEESLDPEVNPYDINFWGNFHGAGGDLHIPGFYYGGGKWILRFTPTSPGEWSYETRRNGVGAHKSFRRIDRLVYSGESRWQ
jgi:hypothetical protein